MYTRLSVLYLQCEAHFLCALRLNFLHRSPVMVFDFNSGRKSGTLWTPHTFTVCLHRGEDLCLLIRSVVQERWKVDEKLTLESPFRRLEWMNFNTPIVGFRNPLIFIVAFQSESLREEQHVRRISQTARWCLPTNFPLNFLAIIQHNGITRKYWISFSSASTQHPSVPYTIISIQIYFTSTSAAYRGVLFI